jgi:CheY-like chemotaxis protein
MVMADKKVLVVDDEIHIVHVVTIKLRNNGYDVVSASDGAEAYELACSEKPDIVVTDYQMPVMSGLELVDKLRQTEQTAGIPVILLTARSFSVEDEQKQRLKINKCLSKPFSPKELLRDIEDVLYQQALSQNG